LVERKRGGDRESGRKNERERDGGKERERKPDMRLFPRFYIVIY
jgi:hypothetical protein